MCWNFQYRLELWFSFDTQSVFKIKEKLRTYYWLKFRDFERFSISVWPYFHRVSRRNSSAWGYIKTKIPGWLNNRIQFSIQLRNPCQFIKLWTLCMLGNFSWFFYRLLNFFFKLPFSKNSFRKTIRVSNGLEPDQGQCSVRPDLGPNCLQRLLADDNSP